MTYDEKLLQAVHVVDDTLRFVEMDFSTIGYEFTK
jgi:hypothetical protein